MQYYISFLILIPFLTLGQTNLTGIVKNKKEESLIGANIHWINTQIGTTTDINGYFEINKHDIEDKRIIISYVGYRNDTALVDDKSEIKIYLDSEMLNAVELKKPKKYISKNIFITVKV